MEPSKHSPDPSRHTSSPSLPQEMSRGKTKYPTLTLSVQRESPPQQAHSKNISISTIESTEPTVAFSTASLSALEAEGWKELDELWEMTRHSSQDLTVTAQNTLADSASTPPQSSAYGVFETPVLPVNFEQLPSTSIGAQFVNEIVESLAATSSRQQPALLEKMEVSDKCNECNKLFKSSRNLKIHINEVHLKIKDFTCQTCNRSFARRETLNCHVRIKHTRETPYKCHVCGGRFLARHSLAFHKKKTTSCRTQISTSQKDKKTKRQKDKKTKRQR